MKIAILSIAIMLLSATVPESKVLICISTGATKYHAGYCRGLKQCTHEIKEVTISEARNRGYSACAWCY